MANSADQPSINVSAIPIAGTGGLGMLALVVIMAIAFPVARWVLIGGLVGGVLQAFTLLFVRRNRQLGAPRDDLPISLFSSQAALNEEPPAANAERNSVSLERQRFATC
jgi:hypothetical protein